MCVHVRIMQDRKQEVPFEKCNTSLQILILAHRNLVIPLPIESGPTVEKLLELFFFFFLMQSEITSLPIMFTLYKGLLLTYVRDIWSHLAKFTHFFVKNLSSFLHVVMTINVQTNRIPLVI